MSEAERASAQTYKNSDVDSRLAKCSLVGYDPHIDLHRLDIQHRFRCRDFYLRQLRGPHSSIRGS